MLQQAVPSCNHLIEQFKLHERYRHLHLSMRIVDADQARLLIKDKLDPITMRLFVIGSFESALYDHLHCAQQKIIGPLTFIFWRQMFETAVRKSPHEPTFNFEEQL